jgi:hypothetical protein
MNPEHYGVASLVLHWQQWYFIAGFVINLIGAFCQDNFLGRVAYAALSGFAMYALWSAGFFTGGM